MGRYESIMSSPVAFEDGVVEAYDNFEKFKIIADKENFLAVSRLAS